MAGVTLLACALILNGYLSRTDALALLAALPAVSWLLIRKAGANPMVPRSGAAQRSMARNAIYVVAGLAFLLGGAEALVRAAQEVARIAGVSELVIGATSWPSAPVCRSWRSLWPGQSSANRKSPCPAGDRLQYLQSARCDRRGRHDRSFGLFESVASPPRSDAAWIHVVVPAASGDLPAAGRAWSCLERQPPASFRRLRDPRNHSVRLTSLPPKRRFGFASLRVPLPQETAGVGRFDSPSCVLASRGRRHPWLGSAIHGSTLPREASTQEGCRGSISKDRQQDGRRFRDSASESLFSAPSSRECRRQDSRRQAPWMGSCVSREEGGGEEAGPCVSRKKEASSGRIEATPGGERANRRHQGAGADYGSLGGLSWFLMSDKVSFVEEARRVLRMEAGAVAALEKRLDSGFSKACRLCLATEGRIVVTGMGKSRPYRRQDRGHAGQHRNTPFFMHPGEAGHGDLGMITSDDIIIALSNSAKPTRSCACCRCSNAPAPR